MSPSPSRLRAAIAKQQATPYGDIQGRVAVRRVNMDAHVTIETSLVKKSFARPRTFVGKELEGGLDIDGVDGIVGVKLI